MGLRGGDAIQVVPERAAGPPAVGFALRGKLEVGAARPGETAGGIRLAAEYVLAAMGYVLCHIRHMLS